MQNRYKTYSKWFLLILFVIYYGSILSNTHAHIVNGVTIVHSHPFHDEKHEHSIPEYQTLHQLNTFYVEDNVIHEVELPLFIPQKTRIIQTPVISESYIARVFNVSLRAPPVFIHKTTVTL